MFESWYWRVLNCRKYFTTQSVYMLVNTRIHTYSCQRVRGYHCSLFGSHGFIQIWWESRVARRASLRNLDRKTALKKEWTRGRRWRWLVGEDETWDQSSIIVGNVTRKLALSTEWLITFSKAASCRQELQKTGRTFKAVSFSKLTKRTKMCLLRLLARDVTTKRMLKCTTKPTKKISMKIMCEEPRLCPKSNVTS